MRDSRKRKATAAGCALLLVLAACKSGANEEPANQQVSLAKHASVTVYPVGMLGRPNEQVAKVVAMMLERGGLESIELGSPAFDGNSAGFSEFAATQTIKTDYALYAEYVGSPKRGVDEVRGVLVDAKGQVVWSECQKRGVRAFDKAKPKDPMSCTVLLVNRLRGPLHLDDPFRKDAPPSKFEQEMKRDSGVPDQAELDAMKGRAAKLRSAGKAATLVVYPARVGDEYSSDTAQGLADWLNGQSLATAHQADHRLPFSFTPDMNEQKVLWTAARSIQAALRKQPVDADYVLVAHYVVAPNNPTPFGVHTFVFDRNGEFVIVDFQNSHHRDFKRTKPTTAANRTKLTTVRLASYLK